MNHQISIIMPAYNRADTIERAIASVLAQTRGDWELIVVDDGSSDNTAEKVPSGHPQIKLLRQQNQGMVGARNAGLAQATGRYIAFLDSDDAWLPHHLALCVGFLESHPEEQIVSAELWEDFGNGRVIIHYQLELSQDYPQLASQVGSADLKLPTGEQDNYLRVYSERLKIGDWAQGVLDLSAYPNAYHYRGNISEKMKWGFLMAMQASVMRRSALDMVGPFDSQYRVAADYPFGYALCSNFCANYLSVPTCIKYESSSDGSPLREGHIASGAGALNMAKLRLLAFRNIFLNQQPKNRELSAIAGYQELYIAMLALGLNLPEAEEYLQMAASHLPGSMLALGLIYLRKIGIRRSFCFQLQRNLRRLQAIPSKLPKIGGV